MNRLASETSPYLLQHKDNPVDWYPWGEEALELARKENKPILLSIGYSACHWCHVMAHESFEDTPTAEVMNRLYVNIKLDREERPDLDKIFQTSHQLLTQRGGGWPLTVFLNPHNQIPYFAGTYFPKQPMQGMPAFTELLVQLAQYYETHQDELEKQSDALLNALNSIQPKAPDADVSLDTKVLSGARIQLSENFDKEWGGFGNAPKFPHPTNLERLLRHWRKTANSSEPDVDALFMTALTVSRMINGGVYDQLGGGFFRYAVDREWQIPHFEKMLYDNGPMLMLTAQLWQASGDDSFRRAASATADWVLREMQSPEGGFYSTLDADSGGEEGLYYLWTPDEAKELTDSYEYTAIEQLYALHSPANFEGKWHLTNRLSLDELMEQTGYTKSKLQSLLDSGQSKLLKARELRERPGRDEKILTSWNGLMIKGLAIASGALQRPELANAAAGAVDFIRSTLFKDGVLYASHTSGQTKFNGYLDDYAFTLDAVVELLQYRWDTGHVQFAVTLADTLLNQFEDKQNGGFFYTANEHEQLLYRPKPFSDEATPAGNGIAALALNRLGYLLGDTRYITAAENTLRAAWEEMNEFPHGHASLITALDEFLGNNEVIIIRGAANEAGDWAAAIRQVYTPDRLIFAIPADAADLPEALATKSPAATTVAYICEGMSCSEPVAELKALAARLSENG